MATIRNNILVENLRGMIGNQLVFRQLRGKTVVSASPGSPRKESEQQRDNRRRFRYATAYAKYMMQNPEMKAYYWHKARELNLPNAYTAAITDYMRKPVISKVSVSTRKKGRKMISIVATKKHFALKKVAVTVKDAQGVVLERGEAWRKETGQHWQYSPAVALIQGLLVEVSVTDRMDHFITSRLNLDNT